MDLRPGAVNLIEEEDRKILAVTQHRTRVDARPAILAEIGVVHEIRGHEVNGALDAFEGAT